MNVQFAVTERDAVNVSTSSEVSEVVGSEQDGGTVPAAVGEQLLADVDDLTGGSDDDRHQFQIATTYQTLVLLQSHRPSVGTVRRTIPERLVPPATQRSVTQSSVALHLNEEQNSNRHTTALIKASTAVIQRHFLFDYLRHWRQVLF